MKKKIIMIALLLILLGFGYWYFSRDPISTECALENCHGLDIKCGANPPQMCTSMYGVGDRCLQYAKCGVQNGNCRQLVNDQFAKCKACVQACLDDNPMDAMKLFECEGQCN